MKGKEVKIGSVYAVRVSGAIAPVRVDSTSTINHYHGMGRTSTTTGWNCTNLRTQRKVHVRGAGKFRRELFKWSTDDKWHNIPEIISMPKDLPCAQ